MGDGRIKLWYDVGDIGVPLLYTDDIVLLASSEQMHNAIRFSARLVLQMDNVS